MVLPVGSVAVKVSWPPAITRLVLMVNPPGKGG
jgi:hypothetical protein